MGSDQYDYSKLSFQKLQSLAEGHVKIIKALSSRLECIYQLVEDREQTCFLGKDILELLKKEASEHPLILGKEDGKTNKAPRSPKNDRE